MLVPLQYDYVIAATGLTFDIKIREHGSFNYMMLKVSNLTNAVTAKISILDAAGDTIWDMTESYVAGQQVTTQAKDTTARYQFDSDIPLGNNWTLRLTLDGEAGSAGTAKCVIPIKTR